MEPTITKVDEVTVQISTPQPDKVVSVPLKVLYQRQANAQALFDSITAQIQQAEALGVVQNAPQILAPEPAQDIITS